MVKESLSLNSRITILVVAFLGWFFGGMQIGMTNLIYAANEYLIIESGWSDNLDDDQEKTLISKWWAYQQCAFLFGAAAGGYIFGKLGDRKGGHGRVLCCARLLLDLAISLHRIRAHESTPDKLTESENNLE